MELKSLIFVTVFATLLAFPIVANALTPEQKIQIYAKVSELGQATHNHDFDTIFKLMPEPLMQTLAKKQGLNMAEFKDNIKKSTLEEIKHHPYQKPEIDLDNGIEGRTTKRSYIIFKATTYIKQNKGKLYPYSSPILGFTDNGTWYLLDIENPNILEAIKQTYPDLQAL